MQNKYEALMLSLKNRFVKGGYSPASEMEIQSFEQKIGYSLPFDYREFIRDFGCSAGHGGFCDPKDKTPDAASVDVFYGLNSRDGYDLQEIKTDLMELGLPSHFLPIARGPGGEFCLNLKGEDAGEIFLWRATSSVDIRDEQVLVAFCFDEFIRRLIVVN